MCSHPGFDAEFGERVRQEFRGRLQIVTKGAPAVAEDDAHVFRRAVRRETEGDLGRNLWASLPRRTSFTSRARSDGIPTRLGWVTVQRVEGGSSLQEGPLELPSSFVCQVWTV